MQSLQRCQCLQEDPVLIETVRPAVLLSQNQHWEPRTKATIATHSLGCIRVNLVVHLMQSSPRGRVSEIEPNQVPVFQVTTATTVTLAGNLRMVVMGITVGQHLQPRPERLDPPGVETMVIATSSAANKIVIGKHKYLCCGSTVCPVAEEEALYCCRSERGFCGAQGRS